MLLFLFTTYCDPCQVHIETLNALTERPSIETRPAGGDEIEVTGGRDGPGDLVVVGVSLDREGAAMIAEWRETYDVRFPVVYAGRAWGEGRTPVGFLQALPSFLLLDAQGRYVGGKLGVLRPDDMRAWLTAAGVRLPARPEPPPPRTDSPTRSRPGPRARTPSEGSPARRP